MLYLKSSISFVDECHQATYQSRMVLTHQYIIRWEFVWSLILHWLLLSRNAMDYLSIKLAFKTAWCPFRVRICKKSPDSKVHGGNMGPTWVQSAPDGPHVGPHELCYQGPLLSTDNRWFFNQFLSVTGVWYVRLQMFHNRVYEEIWPSYVALLTCLGYCSFPDIHLTLHKM